MPCQPRLVTGIYDLTLDGPIKDTRTSILARGQTFTLGFRTATDFKGRKYTYELEWGGLDKADYDHLIELYEAHLDNGSLVTFYYDRWSSSALGVLCNLTVNTVTRKGNMQSYYAAVSIELEEVYPR